MDEQFPWVEEDAFVATGARFFTNESLTIAMKAARRRPFLPFTYVLGSRWQDLQRQRVEAVGMLVLRPVPALAEDL